MTNIITFEKQETDMDIDYVMAEDITGDNFSEDSSGFMGRLPGAKKDKLYLVNYKCVVDAEHPKSTYTGDTPFEIDYWADVQITPIRRFYE